ncbi:MAG: PIN domain-containing protein [Microscillaceae bacterium]|nr:PIN domain-containing protein [Microscillaceae bacterium]
MSGKYLLDTSIIIALLAEDELVKQKITQAIEIYIPAIVIGELYYGAYNSTKVIDNIHKIDNLCSISNILNCDEGTAKIYGQIKNN